jgi:hypothetical protein
MIKENGIQKLFHCKGIEKPLYIIFSSLKKCKPADCFTENRDNPF